MRSTYDVIVVGAGPGGSASAYFLAQAGLHVLLLDKSDFPRHKTCGDALTPRALQVLQEMDLSSQTIPHVWKVNQVKMVAPDGRAIIVPLQKFKNWPSYFLVSPRYFLDEAIRQHALAAGVDFASPVHVSSVETGAWGATVRASYRGHPMTYQSDCLVLATGASTPLLRQAGLLRKSTAVALAARTYFEGIENPEPGWLQFHFESLPLPAYAWVFPLDLNSANVGVITYPRTFFPGQVRPARRPQPELEKFLRTPALRDLLGNARQTGPLQGFPLRIDFHQAAVYGEHLLLVGEAAGMVNPLTGDGIDFALESGMIAAQFLADAMNRGDLSRKGLSGYSRLLKRRFSSLFLFNGVAQKFLASPRFLDWLTRAFELHPQLAEALVSVELGPQGADRLLRRLIRHLL